MTRVKRICGTIVLVLTGLTAVAYGGNKLIGALKDFSNSELKYLGIEIPRRTILQIEALGGGGDYGWTYRSDKMFAYGWILDADTRQVVWEMTARNTSRSRDDREFSGAVELEKGSYELYFAASSFAYHSTFTHFNVNVDHRKNPLFGRKDRSQRDFWSFFRDWWSDDITEEWDRRSKHWGIELYADENIASEIRKFTAPKDKANILARISASKDSMMVRLGFSLQDPANLIVYAQGEAGSGNEMVDYGWVVNLNDRSRAWEMRGHNTSHGGGAKKNVRADENLKLDRGEYALYYVTDDSHSPVDWNEAPPYDPLNYGIALIAASEKDARSFKKSTSSDQLQSIILQMVRMRDNEFRTEGFALNEPARIRIYAFGERSNSRRLMADFGYIVDAKSRQKVWTMDVDKTYHGGGAAKNRFVDEVVSLPKGNYLVTYQTDDSHAYNRWNSDPPFDTENYGITVMGFGEGWSKSVVGKFTEERDKNILAQIVRVGDNANREEKFNLDRSTRLRIYALGEGQNRQMYDYGWIENAQTGNVIWEMTYAMTLHAGGGRKNRLVNTTLLLDKGEYRLRYRSDDSHSFRDWNVTPPEDQQFWGITIYRDDGDEREQTR